DRTYLRLEEVQLLVSELARFLGDSPGHHAKQAQQESRRSYHECSLLSRHAMAFTCCCIPAADSGSCSRHQRNRSCTNQFGIGIRHCLSRVTMCEVANPISLISLS